MPGGPTKSHLVTALPQMSAITFLLRQSSQSRLRSTTSCTFKALTTLLLQGSAEMLRNLQHDSKDYLRNTFQFY